MAGRLDPLLAVAVVDEEQVAGVAELAPDRPVDPASRNGWENQALFGFDDRLLPAAEALGGSYD